MRQKTDTKSFIPTVNTALLLHKCEVILKRLFHNLQSDYKGTQNYEFEGCE